MRELHVAYIASMYRGLDRWVFREIEAIAENGIKVSLFPTKYGPGPYMPKTDWPCYVYDKPKVILHQGRQFLVHPIAYVRLLLQAIRSGTVIDFLLAIDFASEMTRRKIDRVHCILGDHKLFIGYYCKRILGIPLSVALYGYDLRANPNWAMFRIAVESCDDIIVNCDLNRQLLSQTAGSEVARRARLVRHYAEIVPEHSDHKVRVLIVGGFHFRKGHDLLFRAVKSLSEHAANVEIWVAGYRGAVDVKQLARDCGVAGQAKVFGEVSDDVVEVLFEECDIFCLPSRTDQHGVNEGVPVALIEAMAHGKPVISTRVGGIPELVEETLVDEGDILGLAKALERFILDPQLRHDSGIRNQGIVRAHYSKQNVAALRDVFLGAAGRYSCAQQPTNDMGWHVVADEAKRQALGVREIATSGHEEGL